MFLQHSCTDYGPKEQNGELFLKTFPLLIHIELLPSQSTKHFLTGVWSEAV